MIKVLFKIVVIAVLAISIVFMGFLAVLLFEKTVEDKSTAKMIGYFALAYVLMFRPTILYWVAQIRKFIKPTI